MLPSNAGPARDAYILNAVKSGNVVIPWSTVKTNANGHQGEFRVFADALKVDGVRVSVSAFLQQQIADLLSCCLLTAKLSDQMWAQRVATLPPFPQSTIGMSSTTTMIKYSETIDAALAQLGSPPGIVSTVGKNWILTNQLLQANGQPVLKATGRPAACNYGFFLLKTFDGQTFDPCASGIPNCRVIQGRGTAHDLLEVDYSQICQLVARNCFVDGAARDLHDILTDPVLSGLVSSEGPLRTVRQPGVPVTAPLNVEPPCVGPNCPEVVSWVPGSQTDQGQGGVGLGLAFAGTASFGLAAYLAFKLWNTRH